MEEQFQFFAQQIQEIYQKIYRKSIRKLQSIFFVYLKENDSLLPL